MKSRIRSAIPKKIIGINISSQKRDIIEDIAKSENAEAVFFDNEIMGQQAVVRRQEQAITALC